MSNLVDVLVQRAQARPDDAAFIHLHDSETGEALLTYAQLDQRARAIAGRLQQLTSRGDRVLLAYPPGLEFVEGLFGCLYAGCVAVPTSLSYRRRPLGRFNAIVADAGVSLAMSTSAATARLKAKSERHRRHDQHAEALAWLATDEISDEWADRWSKAAVDRHDLAMLQYTSGSTSAPKGVMLSHANLMHNTRAIQDAFEVRPEDTAVSWLPTYHDMGLIGGVMEPVVSGITNILISSAEFLHRPVRWLQTISKYRATISGGPNFAYDLCARKITDEQKRMLDLSSWSLAFVGAEPVQPATLERFAVAFEPCGFDASAFYPCYGLAEATLMVSGPQRSRGFNVCEFDQPALSQHRGVPVKDAPDPGRGIRMASCGVPTGDMRVAIVDARRRVELPPGRVGEIWVRGDSVGRGYWDQPSQTERSFQAHLSDTGDGPFLRTADLGMMHDGELYVTGRSDDLLILRGMNRYPQDLEATARGSHPLLASHRGAAFAVNKQDDEQLVLVHEVTRNGTTDYSPVLEAVSAAVLEEHDVNVDSVVLVRSGTMPKTSSGKIQRGACRAALLEGQLHVLAERSFTSPPHSNGSMEHDDGGGDRESRENGQPESAFAAVCRHARALSHSNALPKLTPRTRLSALGLDSLQRVHLAAALENTFGGRLPDSCDVRTLGELAEAVQHHLINASAAASRNGAIRREHYDIAAFPECVALDQRLRMMHDAGTDDVYFRVSRGAADEADAIDFCSYDYLGMNRDEHVIAAAKAAIDRYGTGAGASRLVSGEKQVHRDLERALASFLGTPDAIVFVSGHATNVTAIGHLLGPGDLIVYDSLAHNSIIQGAQLSGASHRAFAHNDCASLDAMLEETRDRYRRVLIAIEGIYSMDGDWPDLPRLVQVKRRHKALLLVDEAHSLGTLGATGRGLAEHAGVDRSDVDIWMGTLSKAFASCGGFIAGSAELVQYLKYTAPGFVYSVGISPANAAAALASLEVLQNQPQRVNHLRESAELFLSMAKQRGLNTGLAAGSPVVPVIVGNSSDSLRLSRALLERGISAQPILHPAVPEREARLRFFVTVNHSHEQIRTAVDAAAEELAAMKRCAAAT